MSRALKRTLTGVLILALLLFGLIRPWFGLHSNAKLTPQEKQELAQGLEATLGPSPSNK